MTKDQGCNDFNNDSIHALWRYNSHDFLIIFCYHHVCVVCCDSWLFLNSNTSTQMVFPNIIIMDSFYFETILEWYGSI